jgi:signal transduction histidine kinase
MATPVPGPGPALSVRIGGPSAAGVVEANLFRALVVLRGIVLLYALALNLTRFDEFTRPVLAGLGLGVMVLWSVVVSWAYLTPARRTWRWYSADLAVAVGLLLLTPVVESDAMLDRHASTLPTFWVMTSVLAWSVGRGWWQGGLAATVVSVADLSVRSVASGGTWGNIFLLLLASVVVGFAADLVREAAQLRAEAERTAAVMTERARLARVVHDGVLQVLALVQRRGLEAGGDLAELGRLAGEQEVALRRLVQYDARTVAVESARLAGEGVHLDAWDAASGPVDLGEALEAAVGPRVTFTGPGHPVVLPAAVVEEVVGAARACLDNTAAHVGPDAPAWVLVEDLGSEVVVSVRDAGPGIPEGRLDEAAGQGRLGVAESIAGRLRDLGGRAELTTGPTLGTEWELVVPRRQDPDDPRPHHQGGR